MTIVQKLYFPSPALLSAGLVLNSRLETGSIRESVGGHDTVTFVPKPNTRTQSLVVDPNVPDLTRRVTFAQVPQADPNTALVLHGTVHSLAIGARLSRQTLSKETATTAGFIRISSYEPLVLLNNVWFSGEIWLVSGPDLPYSRIAMELDQDHMVSWFHGMNAAVVQLEAHLVAFPYITEKSQTILTSQLAQHTNTPGPNSVGVDAVGQPYAFYDTRVHTYPWSAAAGWALGPLKNFRLIDGYTAPLWTDPEWESLNILSAGIIPKEITEMQNTCLLAPAGVWDDNTDLLTYTPITCAEVLMNLFQNDVLALYECVGSASRQVSQLQ